MTTKTPSISKAEIRTLKREAKRLSRSSGKSHMQVLEQFSRLLGFQSWHHLLRVAKQAGEGANAMSTSEAYHHRYLDIPLDSSIPLGWLLGRNGQATVNSIKPEENQLISLEVPASRWY